MNSARAWIAFIAVLVCASREAPGQEMVTSVTFHTATFSGEYPKALKILSLKDHARQEWVSHCGSDTCKNILQDEYTYRILIEQNTRIIEGTVLLFSAAPLWVTLNLGPTIGTGGF